SLGEAVRRGGGEIHGAQDRQESLESGKGGFCRCPAPQLQDRAPPLSLPRTGPQSLRPTSWCQAAVVAGLLSPQGGLSGRANQGASLDRSGSVGRQTCSRGA